MTRGTARFLEQLAPVPDVERLLAGPCLEVAEQVELEKVDERGPLFDGADVTLVGGQRLEGIRQAVESMPVAVFAAPPDRAVARSGSSAMASPSSFFSAPTMNSRIENMPPW